MKSDLVKKLLRALVTALGIGLGSVLAFVIVQLNAMAGNPAMSIGALLALYAAFALLLGLGGYLIAPRTIDSITRLIALVERCMDKMTFEQQAGSISGLVGGFIIAALLSQLVMLMGASMFTVAMCAILFVVFGVLVIAASVTASSSSISSGPVMCSLTVGRNCSRGTICMLSPPPWRPWLSGRHARERGSRPPSPAAPSARYPDLHLRSGSPAGQR